MIRVSHLTKRYGAHVAVDDVSFEVRAGEVVGFLGPNGAGKSTTLRILAGVLGLSAGQVTVGGHDVGTDSVAARGCVGYMPEAVPLYPEMRVVEYLRFRAALKRVARGDRGAFVDEAMARVGVLEVAHKRIAHLSKGFRQRVGLADAILAKPPVVILDEPTAGLDPNQIREARALVRALGQAQAVLVSSHMLGEVEACASRVLVLHRGRLVAEGPPESLRSKGARALRVVVGADGARARRVAAAVAGVREVTEDAANAFTVHVAADNADDDAAEAGAAAERLAAALVQAGLGLRAMTPTGTLEDVFAALTADAQEPSAAPAKGGPAAA